MSNAEEIIELEKKWFKYKRKQRSKLYILIVLFLSALLFTIYLFYINQYTFKTKNTIATLNKPLINKPIYQDKNKTIKKPILIKEKNNLNITDNPAIKDINQTTKNTIHTINKKIIQNIKEINTTEDKNITTPKILIKEDISKPYFFKLEPTEQGSELFTSNGFLTLNIPFKEKEIIPIKKETQQVIKPIRSMNTDDIEKKETKKKISIDMKEMDTITYLKEKYYATSSIVFALMLAEEYYFEKDYKNSLQWALTANDEDPQNTKSWYWFAKAKVKLNQKEDALRALRAYLANNNSKRLSTLLRKIELGDTDDK